MTTLSNIKAGQLNHYNKFLNPPSPDDIRKKQIERLSFYQADALRKDKRAEQINKFFSSKGKFLDFSRNSSNEQERKLSEAYDNILNNIQIIIQSGALGKKAKDQEGKINKTLIEEKNLNSLVEEIYEDVSKIITQDGIVSTKTLQNLYNFYEKNGTLESVINNIFTLQGDILEVLGTQWLQKHFPNITSIQTGNIRDSKGQQLRQDIMMLDPRFSLMENINIKINGESKTITLGEFLEDFSKNSSTSIILDDPTQKLLQSISIMNIQAKSGKKQIPWNASSKRASVTFEEMLKEKSSPIHDYMLFLEHSKRIYDQQKQIKNKSGDVRNRDEKYQLMADYSLSSQLSKILYLSQMDNQYLLTSDGFISYPERIQQLYEELSGTYPFMLQHKVQLKDTDFFVKSRPVILNRNKT